MAYQRQRSLSAPIGLEPMISLIEVTDTFQYCVKPSDHDLNLKLPCALVLYHLSYRWI